MKLLENMIERDKIEELLNQIIVLQDAMFDICIVNISDEGKQIISSAIGRMHLQGIEGTMVRVEENHSKYEYLFLPTENSEIYAFNSGDFENIKICE